MSSWMKHFVATAIVAASAVAAASASADDILIKLDGVTGDSAVKGHEKEIDALSWSWGASNTGSAGISGGARAGKTQFSALTITKRVDSSSPRLFQSVSAGEHIRTLNLSVLKSGGRAGGAYIKIRLTDVLITSVTTTGNNSAFPTEEVKFDFSKCEFSYVPMKPDGSFGAEIKMGWDLAKNQKM